MIEVITRQRRRLWLAVAAAVLATALSDVGRAADSGTVNADVTVAAAAACIQLSDSSVSFGTLPLGAVSQPATPAITVTNCATTSGTLLANGTNASNAAATWTLDATQATCEGLLGPYKYHLDLSSAQLPSAVRLSGLPQTVQTLAANQGLSHSILISTACPGSGGAGTTLSMQVTYTATA